jgi:hypothetical protein
MDIDAQNIPPELAALPCWLTWQAKPRGQKCSKVPIDASVDDPQTWMSLDDALDAMSRDRRAAGVGFVLSGGIVGLDFDDVVDAPGEIHPFVARAMQMLGSYAEFSASGRGVHIFLHGQIEASRRQRATSTLPAREVYAGRRFFAVTGHRISGARTLARGAGAQAALDALYEEMFSTATAAAAGQLSDETILELASSAKNRAKFSKLFAGNDSDYASPSEADYALVRLLRFYTRDAAQIDRLFRRSSLTRPKWNERHGAQTYGDLSIARAIAAGGPVYTGQPADKSEAVLARERTSYASHVPLWWIVRLSRCGGLALRVLVTIATYADGEGRAFPSVATIARHCRADERDVRRALSTLKAAEVLQIVAQRGAANVYQLAASPLGETPSPYVERGKTRSEHNPWVKMVITPGGNTQPKTTKKPTTIDTGGSRRPPSRIVVDPSSLVRGIGVA